MATFILFLKKNFQFQSIVSKEKSKHQFYLKQKHLMIKSDRYVNVCRMCIFKKKSIIYRFNSYDIATILIIIINTQTNNRHLLCQ